MLGMIACCSALYLHSGSDALTVHNIAELAALLSGAGYEYKPTRTKREYDSVRRRGVAAKLSVQWRSAVPAQGLLAQANHLRLTVELVTRRQVPLLRDAPPEPYASWGKPIFEPHIGRTVSAYVDIDLVNHLTAERLKTEIDRFWDALASYAKDHDGRFRGAEERDWFKVRFDDSEKIDRADPVSLARLASSWGWDWRGRQGGYSSSGWIFFSTIDNRDIIFREAGQDAPSRMSSFAVVGIISLPEAVDAQTWTSTHERSLAPLEISVRDGHTVNVRRLIELSSGLDLRTLRGTIQSFADRIVSLESEARRDPRAA